MDPKLDSPTIHGTSDYLPNPDREPLDAKWTLLMLWQEFKDLPRQALRDPFLFALMFVICWAVTGIAFAMLPHGIQEWLPGQLRVLWWIIGGFVFFGALPVLFGGMSASDEPPTNEPSTPDEPSTSDVYYVGSRGGFYRLDKKGRKRYD
jgi:hypothetical protein